VHCVRSACALAALGVGICNAQTGQAVSTGPASFAGVDVSGAPPKIDGELSAGEWPDQARGEGFSDFETNLQSDEHAEFWLAFDGHFIYFAARAKTDPRRVVDEEYRQNVSLGGNDAFTLFLDAQAQGQAGDSFAVNASGATELRLAGGRAAKTEWLGEFDAVGRKTADGWQVEARIPWELVLRPAAGRRDLLFNVLWYRSNKSNTYAWKFTRNDFRNFPVWTGVTVPDVATPRSLKVLPYAYAGFDQDGRTIANAGVDMKTEVGENLTVVGTANPDFRNIENSILSLDFSYFERLADESRPFFQEGARFRSFGFDQRIFASQRIGEFDAGVNAYGTAGGTNFSVLATTDVGERTVVAASTDTRLDDETSLTVSYAGNLQRGRQNNAGNVLYFRRVGLGNIYLGGQATDDQERKTGHRLIAGYFQEADGINSGFEFVQVSPDFFPRVGFAPERDYRGLAANYNRQVQPYGPVLRNYDYGFYGLYYDRFDGSEYRRVLGGSVDVTFANLLEVDLSGQVSRFDGSSDHSVDASISYPDGSPYRSVSVSGTWGRFQGTSYREFGVSARYRPLRRLQLQARLQWAQYDQSERQVVVSANYDVGRYEAIGARIVQRDDKWNGYVSYRVSGKRGVEWFLILGDPNAREFQRTLVFKVVAPLDLRF
jgi:hypothetical protein